MKVKVKRVSPQLLEHMAKVIGDEIYDLLMRIDHPSGPAAHAAITFMDGDDWHDATQALAQTALNWVIKHDELRNTKEQRARLAFNLSKRLIGEARRLTRNAKKKTPAIRLYRALEDLGFPRYRDAMTVAADTVIGEVTMPPDRCRECRRHADHTVRCEGCGSCRCPIHCHCSQKKVLQAKRK